MPFLLIPAIELPSIVGLRLTKLPIRESYLSQDKGTYKEVIRDRRSLRGDLDSAIRKAGGTPKEERLASAHRVPMKFRDAVSKGDIAVADEAERGEAKFEKAHEDAELLPSAKQFATTATVRVKGRP